jgi:hypothetical protein
MHLASRRGGKSADQEVAECGSRVRAAAFPPADDARTFPRAAMNAEIDVKGLARFETGEDGASIRLTFPTDVLSRLIMTLPQMVTAAVQRRRNDPSARLVYPLAESRTELSTDLSTLILTLKTPDGFTVSFAVSDDQFRELARAGARSTEMRGRLAN